jgi:hypothetical protein
MPKHTAICMRLVNSEAEVNVYNLAKNAGTSVEQIERFYAKNLPRLRNLLEICKSCPFENFHQRKFRRPPTEAVWRRTTRTHF